MKQEAIIRIAYDELLLALGLDPETHQIVEEPRCQLPDTFEFIVSGPTMPMRAKYNLPLLISISGGIVHPVTQYPLQCSLLHGSHVLNPTIKSEGQKHAEDKRRNQQQD